MEPTSNIPHDRKKTPAAENPRLFWTPEPGSAAAGLDLALAGFVDDTAQKEPSRVST